MLWMLNLLGCHADMSCTNAYFANTLTIEVTGVPWEETLTATVTAGDRSIACLLTAEDEASIVCDDGNSGMWEEDGVLRIVLWEFAEPLVHLDLSTDCLLYTSPSPRDFEASRMPSSA